MKNDLIDHHARKLLQYINVITNLLAMGNHFINCAEKYVSTIVFNLHP